MNLIRDFLDEMLKADADFTDRAKSLAPHCAQARR